MPNRELLGAKSKFKDWIMRWPLQTPSKTPISNPKPTTTDNNSLQLGCSRRRNSFTTQWCTIHNNRVIKISIRLQLLLHLTKGRSLSTFPPLLLNTALSSTTLWLSIWNNTINLLSSKNLRLYLNTPTTIITTNHTTLTTPTRSNQPTRAVLLPPWFPLKSRPLPRNRSNNRLRLKSKIGCARGSARRVSWTRSRCRRRIRTNTRPWSVAFTRKASRVPLASSAIMRTATCNSEKRKRSKRLHRHRHRLKLKLKLLLRWDTN